MSFSSPITDLRVPIARVQASAKSGAGGGVGHAALGPAESKDKGRTVVDSRTKYKVSLRIIRGLGLIATDMNGFSDPVRVL
jgi:hypothetical protein